MAEEKSSSNPVRKITKVGSSSYAETIPISIIKKLRWQERQKVVVTEKNGVITIKDWQE